MQDDTIFIIFAELRRFAKQLHECENDLEKMLYIIKNGWRLANQPQELQDEIFTRLFNACDIPRFDEVKRIQYDKDMFDERRYNGEIAAARAEGRNEGREEGRVEGEKFMSHQIAKNMLSMSIDVETIVKATGLTIKEIESL